MIDLRRHNTVLVGHERYFLFQTETRWRMVHDRCPHRGGPLSLARRTPDGRRLSCPWHGTKIGVAALCRTALPMVRSGDEATVVLPGTSQDAPVSVIRRRILANLPPDADAETDPTDCNSSTGSAQPH
ncbi:Rieske (2Fe-2S) protein [Micromonospora polyrhachis]|uniref:Rieske domain-containing protein n=1 Tax=Micromonospora polyrhachis TaxID=1282883 RepID=A0A7W7SLF2_9ACTN|nr:Rieske 2Fe-2S domain-containing protein [Micromonospora polyrhachis]MBB4956889.1 hypothetical protein [Micromonospora polyrhachis]